MKFKNYFLHANNVHQGGGKSLLLALLHAWPQTDRLVANFDTRFEFGEDCKEHLKVNAIPPSLLSRLQSEFLLSRKVEAEDFVLCFGNLPPLFPLKGKVTLFLQNRYLIEELDLSSFPLSVRLRIRLERLWLLHRIKHVDEVIVQTPTMRRLFLNNISSDVAVSVVPYLADAGNDKKRAERSLDSAEKHAGAQFVYVASGEPHKNHRVLIDAWRILSEEGLFPPLILTVDTTDFSELVGHINGEVEKFHLNVTNLGSLPHGEVESLYRDADVLIYPSFLESFGLPLIEASQTGLPVVASELDYVRDVLDPVETFDPHSAVSLARAVKRFLGVSSDMLPLCNAQEFINIILKRAS